MATYQKFYPFVKNLAEGKFNFASAVLKVALTSTAPTAADSVFADLNEVSAGNGYTAGGNIASLTSSTQTSGLYTLLLGNPATWVASGGSIGPFQHAVLYQSSSASKELIGWWSYPTAITLADTEAFAVDFDQVDGVFTLS